MRCADPALITTSAERLDARSLQQRALPAECPRLEIVLVRNARAAPGRSDHVQPLALRVPVRRFVRLQVRHRSAGPLAPVHTLAYGFAGLGPSYPTLPAILAPGRLLPPLTARFAAALQSTSGLLRDRLEPARVGDRTSQVARIFLDFEEVTTQSARSGSGGRVAAAAGMPYVAGMASVRTLRPPVAAPPEPRPPTAPPPSAADFPGCKPVRLPREQLDDTEMRLEYWHAATETAWICDPISSYREGSARLLTRLVTLIVQVRGAPATCFGSTDLTERDAHGEPQLIMQADELVYLHPARAKLPRPVLTVGEHDLPEVVLEVDHTTDARCRKLRQYQAWRFPEVWLEVPEAPSASRPPPALPYALIGMA